MLFKNLTWETHYKKWTFCAAIIFVVFYAHMYLQESLQRAEELRILLESNARLERELNLRIKRITSRVDSVLAEREKNKPARRSTRR